MPAGGPPQPEVDKKKPAVGGTFPGAFAMLWPKELIYLNNVTIGQRIAELRRQKGLSQEALGEALGVTRQSISKWESDGALPEVEKLVAMSRLFGVSVGALLGVEEEAPTGDAEQDAARPEGELSEAQLRMVEEIAARYTEALREEALRQEQARREAVQKEAQEAAEKKKPGKKAIVVCGLCAGVLLYGIISLFSRLERLDNNYRNLSYSIDNVSNNVNRQINSIAYQVENILNEQNALTADFGVSVMEVNAEALTVKLGVYAVPKTYAEGMRVEFLAEYGGMDGGDGGETVRAEGELQGDARFYAELICPLTNEAITVSAAFLRDGVRETQVLDMVNYVYNAVMPQINVIGYKDSWKAAKAGETFTVETEETVSVRYWGGEEAYPIVPEQVRFTNIRVGLFVNRKLIVWATPYDGDFQPQPVASVDAQTGQVVFAPAVQEGSVFYKLPAYTLTLQQGDTVCIAAVAEDQFGNEYVFPDSLLELVSASGDESRWEEQAPMSVDINRAEGWEY